MPTNTLPSKNAKDKKTVAKSTLIDAFTHASITTWETANTDSAAISPMPSEDKLTDQSQPNKPAKSSTTKTTAQMETNADIHTI